MIEENLTKRIKDLQEVLIKTIKLS